MVFDAAHLELTAKLLAAKEAALQGDLSSRERMEAEMAAALFRGDLAEAERLLNLINRMDAAGMSVVNNEQV